MPKHLAQAVRTPWIQDIALFFGLFITLIRSIEDPDIWFHLTVGREVLDSGQIPEQEFYILPLMGLPGEFHEWGFGTWLHWLHTQTGPLGLVLANALVGSLLLFALYRLAAGLGATKAAALAATALGFWLIEFRMVLRPENYLYLAMGLSLYCLYQHQQRQHVRWLLALPLIGWILVQLHPSVLILLLIIGTFLAGAVLRKPHSRTEMLQLAAALVATALLACLNPYGVEQLILPIQFALQTDLVGSLTEFLPALQTEYRWRFIAALGSILFCLLLLRSQLRIAELLMLLGFSLLAFSNARNIALQGVVLVVPLARALSQLSRRRMVALSATALTLAVMTNTLLTHRLRPMIDPRVAPLQAAELIGQHTERGTLLNFFHLGNYLAWRLGKDYPVIVDGRNFTNNRAVILHDRLFRADPGWQQALTQLGVVAVITPVTLPFSGMDIPLVNQLYAHPDWLLVNREPAGVLFLRRDLTGLPNLAYSEILNQKLDELTETIKDNPDDPSVRQALESVKQQLH